MNEERENTRHQRSQEAGIMAKICGSSFKITPH